MVESTGPTGVRLRNNTWMGMRVRPATGRDAREALPYRWYRARLRERVPDIVAKWESGIGVRVVD